MNRVIHFEFAAVDPDKTAKFYSSIFGWTVQKWEGPQEYWLVKTGLDEEPGINGGILRRREGMPSTMNSIGVSSIDAMIQKVTQKGGKVAMAKFTIPGVGYQAYCLDPEGVLFGIHQADSSAK